MNKNRFVRSSGTRNPSSLVLIVCEGRKTEPLYFKELEKRTNFKLDVQHVNDRGVGKVAKKAIELSDSGIYKKIFCVFDKDDGQELAFNNAINDIKQHNKKSIHIQIKGIVSVPCFEFWILLHFEGSAKPCKKCSGIEKQVKEHISDYRKGISIRPALTEKQIQNAIERARKIDHRSDEEYSNPSTKMYILMEELLNKKEENL